MNGLGRYEVALASAGEASEDAWGIAVDTGGIAHVIGTTLSTGFPVTTAVTVWRLCME